MNSLVMFILLAVCGGLGAVCRFLVDSAINKHNHLKFPLGTIVVNVTACFLLGVLTGFLATRGAVMQLGSFAAPLKLIVGTGFLGGYSTFSTASVEGFRQLQVGHFAEALIHTGGMLVLSLIAGLIGLTIF